MRHRILDLIDERSVCLRSMGPILINPDLDLVAQYADRVVAMYAGQVMEEITTDGGSLQATHLYSRGLIASRPTLEHLGGDLPVLRREQHG